MCRPALAQTYDEAINGLLDKGCAGLNLITPGSPVGFGPQLTEICTSPPATPSGSADSSGSGASPKQAEVTALVQQRLATAREAADGEDEKDGGASSDTVVDLGGGLGVYVTGEYESLNKERTRFEDGYDSNNSGLLLGVDYRFRKWLVAGVAVDYWDFDGDYDQGGGFDTDAYGIIGYASFLPSDRTFVDVVLGYARRDEDRTRQASFTDEFDRDFEGPVRGDFNGDDYIAGVFAGYDYSIRNFTIGPRLGLNYVRNNNDSYAERGQTGLELRIDSDDWTSLQSRVGIQATAAFSTQFGVLVTQVLAAWVHEFEDDQRNINASFVQDLRPNPTTFTFETEEPDRDYADVVIGISAVLPNGLQPFANFATLISNSQFDSYSVAIGLRADW
jgi:outer membrane autotransporter protein